MEPDKNNLEKVEQSIMEHYNEMIKEHTEVLITPSKNQGSATL